MAQDVIVTAIAKSRYAWLRSMVTRWNMSDVRAESAPKANLGVRGVSAGIVVSLHDDGRLDSAGVRRLSAIGIRMCVIAAMYASMVPIFARRGQREMIA